MNLALVRGRLLASTVIVGAIISAAPGAAQSVGPAAAAPASNGTVGNQTATAADNDADVIVVTGSRIPQLNLSSTSPVTVIGAAEVKQQGTTRVEDLLNSLPQIFANEGSSDANGASGISTVDLRDLGPRRTLVLINGRRLLPGDPTDPVPDLNFIPASLIKRVDILTGGASSIYGSDALAGVVNFVLDKDFEGVKLDAQYSFYNHDNRAGSGITDALNKRNYPYPSGNTADGFQKDVTLTIGAGTDDGRGHVTAYAGWRQVDALTQGDRDFSTCGLTGSLQGAGTVACGGSSTTGPGGRFQRTNLVGFAAGQPIYSSGGQPSFTLDPAAPNGRGFRAYNGPRDAFNFNPYNYYQRPDERYTLGAFAHYEVNKSLDPYLEVMFMDDKTNAVIAPSGAFYGTDFFINCNNPLASASQLTAICGANAGTGTLQSVYLGRRNVEGGGRDDDLRHTDYRIVAGVRGEIAKGVTYDAYGQFGRSILNEVYKNDFSRSRLNNSLNVVNGPGGVPTCAAALPNAQGIVTDANCLPYNVFSLGGVTPATLAYLQTPAFRTGQTTEYIASGTITALLGEYGFQSPFAEQGVGLSFGAEYRKEALETSNDIEFLTGDLAGQGTPFGVRDTKGAFNVKEGFFEVSVPVVTDKPFIELLQFDGSYRYSDYSTAGQTDTYKLSAIYAPIKDIRVRGTYNRAVRAPNVLELFSTPTVGLFSSPGDDPCAGDAVGGLVNGNTFAQCAASGVTAAAFGNIDASPASQYNQRTSGNPGLSPEIADSYTIGLVIQPSFLRNFTLTIDGFDIRIKKLISSFGADFTLSQCVATGNPLFCNRINRATGSGSLFVGNSFVDNPTVNLGSEQTRGIDVNASYRYEFDSLGSVGFSLVGTYLDSFKVTQLPGALSVGTYNCAGYFGATCGTPLPKWRHSFRLTWDTPYGIQVSGAWRYFNQVKNDLESSNPLLGNGPGTAAGANRTTKIPSQSYFDIALTAHVDKYLFRLGAQNVLDKSPPITPGYTNNGSNTQAQVYDSRGRYIYAGVSLEF